MTTQTMAAGRIAAAGGQPSALRSLLSKIAAIWAERRRIAQTVDELQSLSDHELNDIGIARADIDRVARGLVRIER